MNCMSLCDNSVSLRWLNCEYINKSTVAMVLILESENCHSLGAGPQEGIAVANVACFGQSKFKTNYIDTPHADEL